MAGTNQEFEVEALLDVRKIKGARQFLVKWKNFTSDFNSWEPETNLINCEDSIREFENMVTTRSGLKIDSPTIKSNKKDQSPSPKKRSTSKPRSTSRSRTAVRKRSSSRTRSASRTRTPAVGKSPTRPKARSGSRSRVVETKDERVMASGDSAAASIRESIAVMRRSRTAFVSRSTDFVDGSKSSVKSEQEVTELGKKLSAQGDRASEELMQDVRFKPVVPRGLQKPVHESRSVSLTCSDVFVILLFTLIIVGIVAYQYGYLTDYEEQLLDLYCRYYPSSKNSTVNCTSSPNSTS